MKSQFVDMLKEENFKPFKGKVVAFSHDITPWSGDPVNIYHVEGPDGSKWAIKTADDLKVGSTVKVTKKMAGTKFSDNKFPKIKTQSHRG